MNSSLSIDEQQWLLIVRSRGPTVDMPGAVRASLETKGLVGEGDGMVLTELGNSAADAISAADVDRYKTPPPK